MPALDGSCDGLGVLGPIRIAATMPLGCVCCIGEVPPSDTTV